MPACAKAMPTMWRSHAKHPTTAAVKRVRYFHFSFVFSSKQLLCRTCVLLKANGLLKKFYFAYVSYNTSGTFYGVLLHSNFKLFQNLIPIVIRRVCVASFLNLCKLRLAAFL